MLVCDVSRWILQTVKQISQFAFAGTVGYLADTFTLLLVYPWTGAYAGRFVSFSCAVLTTWLINRSLTFRHQRDGKPIHREFSLYFLSMLGGGAVNLLSYFLVVYLFTLPPSALPVAVAVGSLAGMLVNYSLSKRVVFTGRREKDVPR
tara:strand:- start:31866 stop:32309 length:444 start_codon:yes stop_codon:yes gene_type:complete